MLQCRSFVGRDNLYQLLGVCVCVCTHACSHACIEDRGTRWPASAIPINPIPGPFLHFAVLKQGLAQLHKLALNWLCGAGRP